jgi:hypothetical protein
VQYANARLSGLLFHRSHRCIDMACNALKYIFAAALDAPQNEEPSVDCATAMMPLLRKQVVCTYIVQIQRPAISSKITDGAHTSGPSTPCTTGGSSSRQGPSGRVA